MTRIMTEEDKKAFWAWMRTLRRGMNLDPKLRSYFAIANFILEHANWQTREAFITDETVAKRLQCSVDAVQKARKRMHKRGFVTYRRGGYGRATTYTFHVERAQELINAALDEPMIGDEPNTAEVRPCEQTSNTAEVRSYDITVEVRPCRSNDRESAVAMTADLPPLHSLVPIRDRLPSKTVELSAHAREEVVRPPMGSLGDARHELHHIVGGSFIRGSDIGMRMGVRFDHWATVLAERGLTANDLAAIKSEAAAATAAHEDDLPAPPRPRPRPRSLDDDLDEPELSPPPRRVGGVGG